MSTVPFPTRNLDRDLRLSLIQSGAAKPCGGTWLAFKLAVEALGITDDTPLAFIEYGIKQGGLGHVIRDDDDDAIGVGVREL